MGLGALAGNWTDNERGRKLNDEARANFFKAIKDAEPARIKELAKKSKKKLKKYIKKMEGYGCHQEADLARKATKKKK